MMMNFKKTLLMAALAMWTVASLWAADVNVAGAQSRATRFLQSRMTGKMMAPAAGDLRLVQARQSATRTGSVDYYVFNLGNDGPFVIVAGDDRVVPILAYGDHAIDMNNIPPAMQCMLDQYQAEIDWLARQAPAESLRTPRVRARASSVTVSPLITSHWDQSEPYYNQCPVVDGRLCATGCTATAMAQVMRYWQFPDSLPALPGYTCGWSLDVPALPGVKLQWDDMLDDYLRGQYTPAQGDAVATLMRYCGQAARMEYTPEASGASETHALMALQQFGYNADSQCLYRNFYGRDQWVGMILEDLLAGRPVLYYGYAESSGHAFILDGYDGELFHVNWGWGGYSDGYFALDALGTSMYQFNYYQTMQHHIYPGEQAGGTTAPAYDFESSGIFYKQSGNTATVVSRGPLMETYSGTVTIPSTVEHDGQTLTVTAIGDRAFVNCVDLKAVVVPSTVTSIGRYAFACCESLNKLKLEGGNKTFGNGAFALCYSLYRVDVDNAQTWLTMTFNDKEANPLSCYCSLYERGSATPIQRVVVPGSMQRVGDNQFFGCLSIQHVTLEEGITSIGDNAFAVSDVQQVDLPASLQTIGSFAFAGCLELDEMTLPAGLTSIGQYAFVDCVSLTHVDIPDGITVLPEYVFGDCTNLASVKLPAALTEVGPYAFAYCESLTSASLPSTVTTMGEGAFAASTSLARITLSDHLEAIPTNAFYGCSSLQEITLPASVASIGSEAFNGNSSLVSVNIPAVVGRIGASAFKSCSKLTRVDISDLASWCGITFADQQANPLYHARHLYLDSAEVHDLAIPDGVTSIPDYAFTRCESLTTLTMAHEVESVGELAFMGCKKMTTATLGDGVRHIGEKAFNSCSKLQQVTLGCSVDTVEMYSFGSCSALTSITSRAVTPPYMKGVGSFTDKAYTGAVVRVPRQSLEAYREALVWKRFSSIVGVDFQALDRADVNGDGEVTVADVNAVIEVMLGGSNAWPADVNGDGEVTVADVNAVIDVM